MAHGTPDWGVTAGGVTVYQLTDLAEAVARLGSLDTFDRRGDLVWADDFERGFAKWDVTTDGTGAGAALSTARARNGRYSVLLTAGSDAGRAVTIEHLQPKPVVGDLGVEFSFNLPTNIESLSLNALVFDGTNSIEWAVRWDDVNNRLQYMNAAGAFVTFASGIDLYASPSLFHTCKLVVDASDGQYVRFLLNDVTHNLSAFAGISLASADLAQEIAQITLIGNAGDNDTVYVDDVILTQNEPA